MVRGIKCMFPLFDACVVFGMLGFGGVGVACCWIGEFLGLGSRVFLLSFLAWF